MGSPSTADKYWSKQLPSDRNGVWDYILIGSGMGGMTAAAMLSKMGKRVLVLEQHYVPGGFTHTFKRKSWRWDVGVHAVGEVTEKSMTGRLLTKLTDGGLQWATLGKVYDEFHYPENFRIDFPDSPTQFRQNLIDAFPNEQDAIDDYLRLVREVSAGMKGYYMARSLPKGLASVGDIFFARKAQKYFEMSTKEVVEGLTDDPKLQSILTAQWGYYGSPPSRSSFAMQALVVKHFLYGGYYPVGGSQEIANQLLRTVALGGGWTRVNASVNEILVQKRKAVGVRLDTGEEILAKRVISAVGAVATTQRLLPQEYRQQEWASKIARLSPAPAHVCLYIGLKGDIRKASASGANKWFYNTWDNEMDVWEVSPDKPLGDTPCLYCSFPSLKDPTHDPGPEELNTAEVVTFVPWDAFEAWKDSSWKKRGDDYEEFKEKISKKMLEQFIERMPELKDMIEYVELSTPLSTDYFCRPVAGSIYGIEPTPERFRNPWLKPRTPIKNLYLAGSEVASVGVIGAMMGGVLSVMAAQPVETMRFLP